MLCISSCEREVERNSGVEPSATSSGVLRKDLVVLDQGLQFGHVVAEDHLHHLDMLPCAEAALHKGTDAGLVRPEVQRLAGYAVEQKGIVHRLHLKIIVQRLQEALPPSVVGPGQEQQEATEVRRPARQPQVAAAGPQVPDRQQNRTLHVVLRARGPELHARAFCIDKHQREVEHEEHRADRSQEEAQLKGEWPAWA